MPSNCASHRNLLIQRAQKARPASRAKVYTDLRLVPLILGCGCCLGLWVVATAFDFGWRRPSGPALNRTKEHWALAPEVLCGEPRGDVAVSGLGTQLQN